jgi:iron complex transport system substrate-binding protein
VKRPPLVALLAGVLLAGCGSPAAHQAASSGAASPTTAFPVTISTADGPVTIPHRPTRIMSLSATATSMLYSIGAGPQVVAVDKYSTDPANAPRTGLTGYETGPESYVPYHPDLVVLAYDQSGHMVSQLAKLGIPALLLPAAPTIAASFQQFEELGRATGHEAGARAEVAYLGSRLAQIARSVGNRVRGMTYYHEEDPTGYSATSDTFIGQLYARLGMVDIADAAAHGGNQYPQLSREYVVKADPDFVFLADDECCAQSAATFAGRPGFAALKAVRLHHVFAIPDPIASEWGPRMVDFLAMVAKDVTQGTGS